MEISKTKIDQLGDRLRKGLISEEDLRILDDYRKSYGQVYDEVIEVIQNKLKLNPTGRPAKSTTSVVDKLKREKIRLSQVQDIAGCRLIVTDTRQQDQVVASLCEYFLSASVVDRRVRPSYGYRAVHVIVKKDGKLIEVQIRTELQHQWAELSEKFSDEIDVSIKYGGGDEEAQDHLSSLSNMIKEYEKFENKTPFEISIKWKNICSNVIAIYRDYFKRKKK